jgi:hypothetical protein
MVTRDSPLHIRHNLSARTETLALSVYEPTAMHILIVGTVPQFGGRSGVRGSSVVPMNAHHNGHNLSLETVTLTCFI